MITVRDIEQFLYDWAPPDTAESWDNVGLLVGRPDRPVRRVLVALDVTPAVAAEAAELGADLIVAHHPVIFHPLKRIGRSDVPFRMIKKNISGLCAHTNLDAAEGGVNDILCKLFGVTGARGFAEGGMGRIGQIRTVSAAQLADQCQTTLNAKVKYVDAGRPINTLAVLGGSGDHLIEEALAAGADALLTGEAGHHDALDAKRLGLSLVAAGHFATEFPVVPVLADKLARRFARVRVLCSRRNRDPFTYI